MLLHILTTHGSLQVDCYMRAVRLLSATGSLPSLWSCICSHGFLLQHFSMTAETQHCNLCEVSQ